MPMRKRSATTCFGCSGRAACRLEKSKAQAQPIPRNIIICPILTSRPEIPAQVFRITASYMPESEASKDFYVNSTQWSRRFVGLRLFLALGAAGWKGYGEHVERSIKLTDRLTDRLKQAGWVHANDSPMGVSCMVPPGGHEAVQYFVDAVREDGRFWISKAIYEDNPVLRACVTNGRTDESVIDDLADALLGMTTMGE